MTAVVERPRAAVPRAARVVAALVDPGSYTSWDEPLERGAGPGHDDYAAQLARAAQRAGTDEAVVTGRARVGGRAVALVVSEFAFLGGSVGVAAARRTLAAVRRATRERLPLLALPASGGTRMQEGTPAFVEMIGLTRAVEEHKAAGLPYLVHLRHPTTGGVLASWASRAHVTFAEPGALIGFLGPQVFAALEGHPFPDGVQLAENLAARGIVDDVVPLDELHDVVGRTLTLLDATDGATAHDVGETGPVARSPRVGANPVRHADAWDSIRRTSREDRPGVRDLLDRAREVVWLHGRHTAVRDVHGPGVPGRDALVVALADLGGRVCVVVGQDRVAARQGAPWGPAALRRVRRAFATAQSLALPVVTVVDTPGAELSREAEDGGLAAEIAGCIAELTALPVPTVAVLLGQGTGGGALALLGARQVVAAEHAWLAPLPPQGASVILHGTGDRAAELARAQHVRARDLEAAGFVDVVVPEPADPTEPPDALCRAVVDAVVDALRRQTSAERPAGRNLARHDPADQIPERQHHVR
ncbi:carboxyl transferase domain-containing protein [Isoptericola sp. F-RaC21]|uniref:carboxyl transferase domain-containing protein n=1 Tax=Isoptericola sp. F-RaC21 TaxID=3141452 RepID=UPI00315C1F9E